MNLNNARDNLRIFYRREKEGDLVATFKGNLILDKVLKLLTIDIVVPTWLNSIPLLRRNWINPILTPYCVIFKFIKVLQSRFSLIPKFLWKAKHWCLAFLWSLTLLSPVTWKNLHYNRTSQFTFQNCIFMFIPILIKPSQSLEMT